MEGKLSWLPCCSWWAEKALGGAARATPADGKTLAFSWSNPCGTDRRKQLCREQWPTAGRRGNSGWRQDYPATLVRLAVVVAAVWRMQLPWDK